MNFEMILDNCCDQEAFQSWFWMNGNWGDQEDFQSWSWIVEVTKRLFNLDLKYEVVCDQKASLPRFGLVCDLRASLPRSGFVCDLRVCLPQSGLFEMSIKGLLYFSLELLECWSKVFSTSIWTCWNVDQRSSLLQSRVVGVSIKSLLYLNLEFLKCRSKVFST